MVLLFFTAVSGCIASKQSKIKTLRKNEADFEDWEKNVHSAYFTTKTYNRCRYTITDACWPVSNHHSFILRSSRAKEIWHGLILGGSEQSLEHYSIKTTICHIPYPKSITQKKLYFIEIQKQNGACSKDVSGQFFFRSFLTSLKWF